MYKSFKEVFDKHGLTNVDLKTYQKLKAFRLSWAQKGPEYIDFLGSKLTGVHPIRFSTRDEDMFFVDIFNLDQPELTVDLWNTKGVDKNMKVSSNPFYITIMYLMHLTVNSNDLGKNKEDMLRELSYIFSYKVISSLFTHYFKYQVDTSIALSVNERLSNKFIIKKVNNWQEVFEYRALDILPKGLHYTKLFKLSTDDSNKIISDMQGRLRDMLKNIYLVLIDVIENKDKLVSRSNIEMTDDGASIKESTNRPDRYVKYLLSIINNYSDFIDDDMIYLLNNSYKNISSKDIYTTLEYISTTDFKYKNQMIEDIVVISMEYLNTKGIRSDYNKHMLDVIKYLKGYYISSSVKNKTIIDMKKTLLEMIKKLPVAKVSWNYTGLVTFVMIYMFIRSVVNKQ